MHRLLADAFQQLRNRVSSREAIRSALLRPFRRPLRILQVCPSLGTPCGVANFSDNFAHYLAGRGFQVHTSRWFEPPRADLVLVQHEFGLFQTEPLKAALANRTTPAVLFCHTATGSLFEHHADAFLAMCPGMVQTRKPTCVVPHPGWYSGGLTDRDHLKAGFGYQQYSAVVGSNGFLNTARQFSLIARKLLPFAERNNCLINLLCSKHATHARNRDYQLEERALRDLAASSPNLRLDLRMKTPAELNAQFQACDLLWCWTAARSGRYASGTCSDQYCSGTRMLVAAKRQHGAVAGRPNVVTIDGDLDAFVQAIVQEIEAGNFARHDGSDLSWERSMSVPAQFLRSVHARPSVP